MPHHHQQHHHHLRIWLLLLVVLCTAACGTDAASVTPAAPAGEASLPTEAAGVTPSPAAATATVVPDPTATAPAIEPCGASVIVADPVAAGSLHELAWFSSVIVVGTVSGHGEAYTATAFAHGAVATDYTVTVQTLVRGRLADPTTLHVRQFGDAARGCTSVMGDPAFAVGDRVLLFLRALPDAPPGAAQLAPFGMQQGVWHLADDDIATATSADPFLGSTPLPLPDVLGSIVTSLHGSPPTGTVGDDALVPLEDAPLVLMDDRGDGGNPPTATDAATPDVELPEEPVHG